MNMTKILVAGLVGAVVAFVLGYLFWGLLLADFFASNAGSATGVMREDSDTQWIPMILGHLSWGFLLAYIFGRWASISTAVTGAKAGAILGFLIAFSSDMISLGTSHVSTWTSAIADIVVMTVIFSIVGAVVGWMLGRGGK